MRDDELLRVAKMLLSDLREALDLLEDDGYGTGDWTIDIVDARRVIAAAEEN